VLANSALRRLLCVVLFALPAAVPARGQAGTVSLTTLDYNASTCRQAIARANLGQGRDWWCIQGIASHPSGVTEVRVDSLPAVLQPDSGGAVRYIGFVPVVDGERQVDVVARATSGATGLARYRIVSQGFDPEHPDRPRPVLARVPLAGLPVPGTAQTLVPPSTAGVASRPAGPPAAAAAREASAASPQPTLGEPAATATAGVVDTLGDFIEILSPAEWSGIATRGIELPAQRSVQVVGFARHPSGITSVEIDGRVAALTREGGKYTFTGFAHATAEAREVVILAHPVDGLPIIRRYTLRGTPSDRAFRSRQEAESQLRGQRWALVVGISSYADSAIKPLKYADDDAQAVYDFLRSPRAGLGGFAEDHVRLLLNEQATYAAIRSALFSFLGQAAPQDEVVIYFAGHGKPDQHRPGDTYLLTHDARDAQLSSTALPMRDLNRAVAALAAKHVVLITDACHSGGVTEETSSRGDGGLVQEDFLARMNASQAGLAVFTASGADQLSFEDAKWGGGHGIFTYFLLRGLYGAADEDGDQIVTAVELMHWTMEQVRRETRNTQVPSIGDHSFDQSLPLSLVLTPEEEQHARQKPDSVAADPEVARRGTTLPPALAQAIARAEDAVRHFPSSPPYRHNLGKLYQDAQRMDDAIRELIEASRLEPSNAEYRYSLGMALQQANRLPEAIEVFRGALLSDRENPLYHFAFGVALLSAGRAEEAVASLRRAVRIQPANARSNAALGRALWKTGRLRDAVVSLQAAVLQDPSDASYRRDLAMILAENGQLEQALTDMREAAKLAPGRADYVSDFSIMLLAAGRSTEALQAMQSAAQLDSANAVYRNALGNLYRAAGQKYEALLEFRAATRLDPANPVYHFIHGELLGESDDTGSALDELREAVRLAPDSARFVNGLGRVLRRASLPAEAIEAFIRATQLEPGQAEYHFDLGTMYVEAGRYGDALTALQRAVQLQPGNRDYSTQLRNVQRRVRGG
jgi:tetratricopeptide (TPR) repeat protein